MGFETILGIVAPLLLGNLFGGGGSSTEGGSSPATASDPYSAELSKMAYRRVAQSQPLYEAVLKMANARLPRIYQATGPAPSFTPEQPQMPTSSRGTGNGPNPWPRQPNYTGLPDYMQGIVKDPYRSGDRLEK